MILGSQEPLGREQFALDDPIHVGLIQIIGGQPGAQVSLNGRSVARFRCPSRFR
jgi:hypothetical protein